MPLHHGGSDPWPPPDCKPFIDDARAWAAWWSGDLGELMATSGSDTGDAFDPVPDYQERRFSMGPTQRRRFWQRRADSRDQSSAMKAVHAPLAGDIAETSADLLFGEPPDLTVESEATQQALEELVEATGLWSMLLEGAETCAGVGGVYLRPVWDTTLANHPLGQVIEQDRAVPDFRYGRLQAVTFWETLHEEGNQVWRHLERHEPGVILHGLFVGTRTTIGDPMSLNLHPATRGLEPEIRLPEGLPRPLLVSYVPNVLPNRRRRGKPIGRADIAGSESFLDSLDEVWSSWMRDHRLGQAKIIAPDEWLQPAGFKASSGKTLDLDRDLFTGLDIAEIEKLTDPIKMFQPDIRVQEHAASVVDLVRSIVSASGYSPQTYGLDIEGQAESGTALRVREKKTLHTVKRKRGYWQQGVADFVENMLALNASLFGGPAPERPVLTWPDLTDDPVERANTTSLWHTAEAVSLRERVKARNPEWEEEAVDEEVALIEAEKKAAMPVMDLPPTDEAVPTGGSNFVVTKKESGGGGPADDAE